jgi:hypothetical protein
MAEETPGNDSGKKTVLAVVIGIVTLLGAIATAAKGYYEAEKARTERDRLQSLVEKPSNPAGRYSWEVASERWWGYIDVNDQGIANLQMWRFTECPDGVQRLRLFDQVQSRTARVSLEPDSRLHVDFPVQQIRYDDKCNRIGQDPPKTLTGYLDATRAYDGEVGYQTENGEAPPGGMILIKRLPGGH